MKLPDSVPIDDLGLSTRTRNICRNMGLKTLGDIRNTTEAEFLRVPECGRKSVDEILAVRERNIDDPIALMNSSLDSLAALYGWDNLPAEDVLSIAAAAFHYYCKRKRLR